MKQKLLQSNLIIFTLMLFCLTCFTTFGQTKKISMQGFLKDANGKAIADGPQSLTFKIYTVALGGTAIWTEVQPITISGGVYSAQLGSVTNISTLAWDVPYFVGVTVQGTELSPRTELTYAPYSFGTNKAQEVVCSGAVGDVKYSILNPTQFADVNGPCWVPMDGRSMTGSKLATILGGSTVPNAGGLFLRGQESANGSTDNDPDRTLSSTIAILQNDTFKSHAHTGNTSSAGQHQHNISYNTRRLNNWRVADGNSSIDFGGVNIDTGSGITDSNGLHTHSLTIDSNGTAETRPKNLNLWTYIRIN